MKEVGRTETVTGGRDATMRYAAGDAALSVGMPPAPKAPVGWRWVALTEAAQMESGHTPSRRHSEYWVGDIPWIGVKDAGKSHGATITDTTEHTNELGIANSSARLLPKGTVCLSRGGTVGYVVILGRPMATSQGFANWICGKELNPRFLTYLFLNEIDALHRFSSGATIQTIYYPDLKAFHVCIPPLPEQKNIVGILDRAFEGIATAKANAEKNLQNTRALFDSYLQTVFTPPGHGWQEKRLGDVADVQSGGTPSVSRKEYWGGGTPWYSSGELNDLFTVEPERTITDVGLAGSNAKVFPKGALLIGMYDTAALKMSLLDRDAAFNQAIAGVRPNAVLSPEFLLHAINAIKPRLLLERRGVRQKNLSLGKIKDILVPVPPRREQESTVTAIGIMAVHTQHLESLYRVKVCALDELKRSLLHQAFSGKL
jgi:type I restriction enzyme S subunit